MLLGQENYPMKANAIIWSIWLFVFGSFITQMAKAFSGVPLSITPHWLTLLPCFSIVIGLVGLGLYKVSKTAVWRKRKVNAAPVAAPLPELTEA